MTYIPTITDKEIATVKFALRNHQGAGCRISVEELTKSVYGKYSDNNRRKLRAVIHEINTDANDKMLILTDTASGVFVRLALTRPRRSVITTRKSHAR